MQAAVAAAKAVTPTCAKERFLILREGRGRWPAMVVVAYKFFVTCTIRVVPQRSEKGGEGTKRFPAASEAGRCLHVEEAFHIYC